MDVKLRPFDHGDFEHLIAWVDSPELMMIWSGTAFQYPLDPSQLEGYLQTGQGERPIRRIYSAVDQDRGRAVGHIELNNIDLQSLAATVSRVLVGKPYRRQGVGQAMLRQVLATGFDFLGLHRIDLVVFDFNQAAIDLYTKNGFVLEGVLRHHRRMGEAYWNNCIMSILEDEWRIQKGGKGAPGAGG